MKRVEINDQTISSVVFDNQQKFSLICGPCQLETLDHALITAEQLHNICEKLDIDFVFKASFDKANRTSLKGQRGVGIDKGLEILQTVREQIGVPVLTDIHDISQVKPVAEVVDILQIPAFLCRQTDLLLAAAQTGKVVNVKKGQFLAPQDMQNVVDKILSENNENILLTDRGTMFGYGNLISDMRGLRIMAQTEYPVIFDATHSVQMPSADGSKSGGKREFVEPLARAAVAVGVAGLFMETHEDPDKSPSDGPNMVPLAKMEGLLTSLKRIDEVAKANKYQDIPSS